MSVDVTGRVSLPPTEPAENGTPVTVRVKSCCGVLAGEVCDCREFAAEARGVFARPIMCRPASEWNS